MIKGRKSIKEYTEKDWFYDVRDLYIKSIDEIYDRAKKYNFDLKFLELAIDSTFEIRDNVNIEMPEYPNNFPKFNLNYKTSEKQFMDKLKLKWDEKIKNGLIPSDKIKDYKERLSYEL